MMQLEICVDSVESAVTAELGGAQRIELCSSLTEGGITPSAGLLEAVRDRVTIGVHVMVRPRGGDFLYSKDDVAVMRRDIANAAASGADGVVLGLLTADGRVDIAGTRELVAAARPMQVTFHRAIDMTVDLDTALEDVIRSGADRILTSGAASSAMIGAGRVASLVRAAGTRIRIMVCGGVRPENVEEIARVTGANDFHAALRTVLPSPATFRKDGLSLGDPAVDSYDRYGVRLEDVRGLRSTMDKVSIDTALHRR
jgi:copper homeostasis protein